MPQTARKQDLYLNFLRVAQVGLHQCRACFVRNQVIRLVHPKRVLFGIFGRKDRICIQFATQVTLIGNAGEIELVRIIYRADGQACGRLFAPSFSL
jgi:hypothetical protein